MKINPKIWYRRYRYREACLGSPVAVRLYAGKLMITFNGEQWLQYSSLEEDNGAYNE